jgi:hypothetical protein
MRSLVLVGLAVSFAGGLTLAGCSSGGGGSESAKTAPLHFDDVNTVLGIGDYTMAVGMGSGIAAVDYDDDGDVDLFVPNGGGKPDQLYENIDGRRYQEVAASVGLASTDDNRCGIFFDYDADGDLDLIVVSDDPDVQTSYRLHRHEVDGTFTDVTAEAGLFILDSPRGHRGGVCAGDINNDGFLDLFAGVWGGLARLFVNNGQGGFTDVTETSGIKQLQKGHWEPMMFDFDGDGWTDIYQAIDFTPNYLWINQHDGTFVDLAPTCGLANLMNDMGMSLADYDNDGDMDIYTTNIDQSVGHNALFRNDTSGGVLSFTEVAREVGVSHGGWGWGNTFFDANNDGWLDIAATNGFMDANFRHDVSRFWINKGGPRPTFHLIAKAVGFNDSYWGSCVVAFDYDRDGDLDLAQTCVDGYFRVLENNPTGKRGGYLVVQPRMDGPNHFAVGAVVRVRAGGLNMMRLITAGTSFLGQEPFESFFGLGDAAVADSVTVEFPDGRRTVLTDVRANQIIQVEPET